MAFTQVLINRNCPTSSFEQLEEVVANHVGRAVYGSRYPEDAAVDVATQHGRLDTHMALKVEIDTEDLPGYGWHITPSGLCLPFNSKNVVMTGFKAVPQEGLSDIQRNAHFAFLGKEICEAVASDPIWEEGAIGWMSDMDHKRKLGVLVARAEGAWHATYSMPE